jgi:CDP-diacylglycerol--glycerol-3-phosphate 3-phosphatidyltransferase
LRSVAAAEQVVIAANWTGKLKTATQVVAISLLIVYTKLGEFQHLAPLSLWAALLVSVWSGVDYYVRFGRLLLGRGAADGPPSP